MIWDRIRYALIRWLADGDMIVLGAEYNRWGNYRPKNAGQLVVMDCDFTAPFGMPCISPHPLSPLSIDSKISRLRMYNIRLENGGIVL